MGLFRGLIFALFPSLLLWAMIGVVTYRTYQLLSAPPELLLALVEQGSRIN